MSISISTRNGAGKFSMTNVKYGLLYNWYCCDDARKLANTGWRVPSEADYNTLIIYMNYNVYERLMEVGTTYWNSPAPGTNTFKFNLRGTGYCGNGVYEHIKEETFLRISNNFGGYTMSFGMNKYGSFNESDSSIADFPTGLSVRLLKDSTTLTHGQEGTYTGNDGKVYRTICIGTQEWLADNLCETKYMNGDSITQHTDPATFEALETGALCVYNNDWNNAFV
jgi:uncharacterized protein (TIGR02145 family)